MNEKKSFENPMPVTDAGDELPGLAAEYDVLSDAAAFVSAAQMSPATLRALELAHMEELSTDPLGSWTGHPANDLDKPIQDADDL